MKVLFVGLGSIGLKHLTNLAKICEKKGEELIVHALRSTGGPLPQPAEGLVGWSFTTVPDYEYYDAIFITNPTNLHADALAKLADRGSAFFVEKPIFEHAGYRMEELGFHGRQKVYVAAPLRWTALYRELKRAMAQRRPFAVRAVCSSYLPGWRPGRDYRQVYSARAAMGGGVTLDLIHEWDYLTDLFGYPQSSVNMRGKFSNLEIDSDDLSVYIARYKGFLLELHLDYFGRAYRRSVEIFTEEGSLNANFGSGLLTLENGEVVDCAEDPGRRYERELEYFLSYMAASEQDSVNSPANALEVLKIALGSPSAEGANP